jgi:hypothetical protein
MTPNRGICVDGHAMLVQLKGRVLHQELFPGSDPLLFPEALQLTLLLLALGLGLTDGILCSGPSLFWAKFHLGFLLCQQRLWKDAN